MKRTVEGAWPPVTQDETVNDGRISCPDVGVESK